MYYLYNFKKNWADEFDVAFIGVLNEHAKKVYDYAVEKLNHMYGSYYFGSNEGWDDDFDYLDLGELTEISKKEYSILDKLDIFYMGYKIKFLNYIQNEWEEYSGNIIDIPSVEDYYKMIDDLYKLYNEVDED